MHGAERIIKFRKHHAAGSDGLTQQLTDDRNFLARIGELPAHEHDQAEAEEQEDQRRHHILNTDDFVVSRKYVLTPKTKIMAVMTMVIMVMMVIVRVWFTVHKRPLNPDSCGFLPTRRLKSPRKRRIH